MIPQEVVVVVANWNGRHLLPDCLQALADQTFRDFEIIVVDNGSTDGSSEWLRNLAPTIHVIYNQSNLGFAVANNQGIRASAAPLIATLNNDAIPDRSWLQSLVTAAEQDKSIGMFASRIILKNSDGLLDSAGIEVDRLGIAWNRLWLQSDSAAQDSIDIFGPSAAAALYRRSMLDQIGLFDEDLFAYYEDVDLAWRAQWAGWRCRYVPAAFVQHIHSATGVQGSPFKSYWLGRNKWRVIIKNYPFRSFFWYIPLMIIADWVAMVIAVLKTHSFRPVSGRWAGWLYVLHARHARREVQSTRQPINWRDILNPVHIRRQR